MKIAFKYFRKTPRVWVVEAQASYWVQAWVKAEDREKGGGYFPN